MSSKLSPESVKSQLSQQGYIAQDALCVSLFLAMQLKKPLLIEGPAGVGKTELAKVYARMQSLPFLRLQCYEGLDEGKALYEWDYAKQLLYTQILKEYWHEHLQQFEKLEEAVTSIANQESVFFSKKFLLARPLLQAVFSEKPCVLLIDEVDKADPEFEAFLLEFLAEFSVTIPELGTFEAKHPPMVFLTSNDQRDLSDALRRRCLHLYLDYPSAEQEVQILQQHLPNLEGHFIEQAIAFVQRVRVLDLKKAPSISESLDWVQGLVALQWEDWQAHEPELANTLAALLKHQEDQETVLQSWDKLIQS